jgi:uncharacterized membrane protein (UPF0127 family)
MKQLIKYKTGQVVLEGLAICSTFHARLTGYLLKSSWKKPGLLFMNTARIHTFGMRFSLDLYFFDSSMRVLGITTGCNPMRIPLSPERTHHILEIPHLGSKHPLDLEVGESVYIIGEKR